MSLRVGCDDKKNWVRDVDGQTVSFVLSVMLHFGSDLIFPHSCHFSLMSTSPRLNIRFRMLTRGYFQKSILMVNKGVSCVIVRITFYSVFDRSMNLNFFA